MVQLLTIGVTISVLVGEIYIPDSWKKFWALTSFSGSRLGNLGWHTQFTSEGIPVNNDAFRSYGKVRSGSDRTNSSFNVFL